MKAYVIYVGDIIDEVRFQQYREQADAHLAKVGGKYVVATGSATLLEGALPASRTVIIEFPSRQAALDWYESDEYTQIRKLREGADHSTMYLVDCLD